MTPSGRLLIAMVSEALERGEVRLDGERLIKDGQPVTPVLSFEPDSRAPSAGVRLGVSTSEDQDDMSDQTFAPLPEPVLVASDQAAAERARRSQRAALQLAAARQQAARRLAAESRRRRARTPVGFAPGFAPLPPSMLPKGPQR